MSVEETILYAVLTPLVGAGLIAVTGSRPNLREAVTLASGVVLFVLVADLYPLVAAGRTPSVDMMEMLPGLAISFTVEPLPNSTSAAWAGSSAAISGPQASRMPISVRVG